MPFSFFPQPLNRLSGFASPLALLATWALVANAGWFPTQLLVPPRQVYQALIELIGSGELHQHLCSSLSRLAIGFTLGASGGLLFGTAMALSKTIDAYCAPLFHTLRQIPSIALIPMFILFFGVEETFKVLIVTKAAFFPVALAACEGIKGIPRGYFEVTDVYRLPLSSLFKDLALPAAAPPILTGLRISLSRSWMVLVAAELLAADSGLGQMIEMGRQTLRIDIVMVGVMITGIIGFTLDHGLRLLEKRLLRWKPRA